MALQEDRVSGSEALSRQLRAEVPAGLGISDADQERLADLVRSARKAQGAELERSLLAALDHLPRLLRGPVRKLFVR